MARAASKESSSGFMVKELRVERERSKLSIEPLTKLLDGGEIVTEIRRSMSKIDYNIKKSKVNKEMLFISPSFKGHK